MSPRSVLGVAIVTALGCIVVWVSLWIAAPEMVKGRTGSPSGDEIEPAPETSDDPHRYEDLLEVYFAKATTSRPPLGTTPGAPAGDLVELNDAYGWSEATQFRVTEVSNDEDDRKNTVCIANQAAGTYLVAERQDPWPTNFLLGSGPCSGADTAARVSAHGDDLERLTFSQGEELLPTFAKQPVRLTAIGILGEIRVELQEGVQPGSDPATTSATAGYPPASDFGSFLADRGISVDPTYAVQYQAKPRADADGEAWAWICVHHPEGPWAYWDSRVEQVYGDLTATGLDAVSNPLPSNACVAQDR